MNRITTNKTEFITPSRSLSLLFSTHEPSATKSPLKSLFAPVLLTTLTLSLACGPKNAQERERQVASATELVEEGGVSPFQARLNFKSPEAMAIQEVPYAEGKEAEASLWNALQRYRGQWTMALTIEPKPTAKPDPQNPMALDIENNGGMWGNYSRNLNRLMFEMGSFIRLQVPGGQELEPSLVEFQRNFGMGQSRTFLLVFPKNHDGKPLTPPFELRVREFGQGLGLLKFKIEQAPSEMAFWRLKRLWKASAREASRAAEHESEIRVKP